MNVEQLLEQLRLLQEQTRTESPQPVAHSADLHRDIKATIEQAQQVEHTLRTQNEELLQVQDALTEQLLNSHAALLDDLQKYRDLFESCPSGYVVTDAKGIIREANQTLAAWLGWERDFLKGKPLSGFVCKLHIKPFCDYVASLSHNNHLIGPLCLRKRDGQTIFLQAAATTARGTQGSLQTVRWVLQEPLNTTATCDPAPGAPAGVAPASEDYYRNLVESSPQPIVVQCGGQIVYCNAAAVRLMGASRMEEIIGKPIFEIIHPDFHNIVRHRMPQVLEDNGVAPTLEEKLVRLDGEVVDVEVTASQVCYIGQPAVQVVMQDISSRKLAEKALRAGEERFRAFMDLMPALVSIRDQDGRYVYLNKAAQTTFNGAAVHKQNANGLHRSHHSGEETTQLFRLLDAALPADGEPHQSVETVHLPDSHTLDWLLVKFPLQDSEGQRLQASIAVDISERMQVEKALRESERKLQAVISTTPLMLFVVDRNEVFTLADGKGLHKLVRSQQGIVGKTVLECFGDAPQILENSRRGLAGETFYSEVQADGLTAEVFIAPLKDDKGQNDGYIAVAMDISERRQVEAQRDELFARERAARAEAEAAHTRIVDILDSIGDCFFTLDRDWRVTYANLVTEQITSRPRHELFGRRFWEVFPNVRETQFYTEYQRAMREQKTVEFEALYPTNNSWYAVRAYPGANGLSVFAQDITARKQAEAARQELLVRLTTVQEEERWRIARDLHDQFGQDLTVLMLGLKSLPRQHELAPEVAGRVGELQETVQHLMRATRRVALDLRPEGLGTQSLPSALRHYVKEWSLHHEVEVVFHSWGFRGRRVAPAIEASVYRVVQEALTNILRHAEAKSVSVLLEHRRDQILVIIEDDGKGFDVNAVMSRPPRERGLGLRGMEERVALVNGALQVESSTGKGTTIYVRIPVDGSLADEQGQHG